MNEAAEIDACISHPTSVVIYQAQADDSLKPPASSRKATQI
jgi:hypothetical protein